MTHKSIKICQFDIFLYFYSKSDYHTPINTIKGAKDGRYDRSILHSDV